MEGTRLPVPRILALFLLHLHHRGFVGSRTDRIIEQLGVQRALLESAAAEIPVDLHGVRPDPERWSVSEILEHLVIVQRRVLRLFTDQLLLRLGDLAPDRDDQPVLDLSVMDRLIDRSRKVAASEAAQPKGQMPSGDSLRALQEDRQQLVDIVTAADGLSLNGITAPHPRFGELNLYQWLLFLGGHEARHAAQIREVGSTLPVRRDEIPAGGGPSSVSRA